MSRLASLKAAESVKDLARLLKMKASGLSYILYKMDPATKYSSFEIPKKSGGTRTIHAPTEKLKRAQKQLADLLQDCIQEQEKAYRTLTKDKRPERISHGFHRGRSIITNAQQHRHRRYVLNVDIENFFGSIHFGRVRGLLQKDKSFSLKERVATAIAHLACHNGTLPQGSPCSPVISNLVGRVLDFRLAKLANGVGCSYSRYADDLTFSTNERAFPPEIAVSSSTNPGIWIPGPSLLNELASSGFNLNGKKTRMQVRTSRQMVTGLVVNSKVNVPADYRRTVRAMVHSLYKTGSYKLFTQPGEIQAQAGTLDQLQGMLGFIDSVDQHNRKNRPKHLPDLRPRDGTYKHFLWYRNFYSPSRPTLLTEGKTDNIYLTHAIRALAPAHPKLATLGADGSIKIMVRRFKHSGAISAKLLHHGAGASALWHFIDEYHDEYEKFGKKISSNPVIIVVDNDSGPRDKLFPAIASKFKKKAKPTWKESFVHIFGNLYIVPTPLNADDSHTEMEDFFAPDTKKIEVGGKTFDPKGDGKHEKTYGKAVFSTQVVESGKYDIDFSGFKPLLDRIESAIVAHAKFTQELSAAPPAAQLPS